MENNTKNNITYTITIFDEKYNGDEILTSSDINKVKKTIVDTYLDHNFTRYELKKGRNIELSYNLDDEYCDSLLNIQIPIDKKEFEFIIDKYELYAKIKQGNDIAFIYYENFTEPFLLISDFIYDNIQIKDFKCMNRSITEKEYENAKQIKNIEIYDDDDFFKNLKTDINTIDSEFIGTLCFEFWGEVFE